MNKLTDKHKAIIYAAWSLRNQFNGVWDSTYFPAMAKALDEVFSKSRPYKSSVVIALSEYPLDMLPKDIKRRMKVAK